MSSFLCVTKIDTVYIQAKEKCGVPLTIGVKIIEKSPCPSTEITALGFDVIFFAELWIRNLTDLPLVFGAPSVQIYHKQDGELGEGDLSLLDSAGKVAAEAALMEITSVLELGDKGKGLSNGSDEDDAVGGDLYNLPTQQNSEVVEEVFEYLEIKYPSSHRRWWASEMHDKCRPKPTIGLGSHRQGWQWSDDRWLIDCAGHVSGATGGWESCKNLVGGIGKTFMGRRVFDPFHSFRRRRWFRRRQKVFSDRESRIEQSHLSCLESNEEASDDSVIFHQPVIDASSRAHKEAARNALGGQYDRNRKRGLLDVATACADDGSIQINIKCGDGQWSAPALIPPSGSGDGVLRVLATRWPQVTKMSSPGDVDRDGYDKDAMPFDDSSSRGSKSTVKSKYSVGCLCPESYDLCYNISVLGGLWGEFSRLLMISARYFVRNDSQKYIILIKQVGKSHVSCINAYSLSTKASLLTRSLPIVQSL